MKKVLYLSGLTFFLSLIMFVGITYAWFNETIIVKDNTIKTGKFDVSFIVSDNTDFTDSRDLQDRSNKIFDEQHVYPGQIITKFVKVSNVGTIDLAYQFNFIGYSSDEVGYFNNYVTYTVTSFGKTNTYQVQYDDSMISDYHTLKPGNSNVFVVVFRVNENMPNEGQNHFFNFRVALKALQVQQVKQMPGAILWPDLN